MIRNRAIRLNLQRRFASKLGRLIVLTGARQTGKTTLARQAFPDLPYISVEDPAVRPAYSGMSAADWISRYPRAIIDEVQKAPAIVEAIQAAHDREGRVRYILLGSSQILLLSRVKESLAGRASIEELWPLTLPEMDTYSWHDTVGESRLVQWLKSGARQHEFLLGEPAASSDYARFAEMFRHFLRFGGMPVVVGADLTDTERLRWLKDYQRTYLERDVSDLAALRDLEPFVLAQRAIAGRTGRTVNFSDLARVAGVAPVTARRFMRYLELSYQVILLQPYFRNPEKRLAKMPKVHWVDPGVMRAVISRRGDPTGEEFESAVVAEIYKQIQNAELPAELYHLRTHDGREVDLLIELEEGFVSVEIKMTPRVASADARALRDLESFLDKPLLKALLLSLDRNARLLSDSILALPVAWALSPAVAKPKGSGT